MLYVQIFNTFHRGLLYAKRYLRDCTSDLPCTRRYEDMVIKRSLRSVYHWLADCRHHSTGQHKNSGMTSIATQVIFI